MSKLYLGFAIADSMFSGDVSLTRHELSPEETQAIISQGKVVPCLNPSHMATIEAMKNRFGIEVEVPEKAPQVALNKGDRLMVMSVRGLPRLDATRHEYTSEEIAGASFKFAIYTVS